MMKQHRKSFFHVQTAEIREPKMIALLNDEKIPFLFVCEPEILVDAEFSNLDIYAIPVSSEHFGRLDWNSCWKEFGANLFFTQFCHNFNPGLTFFVDWHTLPLALVPY